MDIDSFYNCLLYSNSKTIGKCLILCKNICSAFFWKTLYEMRYTEKYITRNLQINNLKENLSEICLTHMLVSNTIQNKLKRIFSTTFDELRSILTANNIGIILNGNSITFIFQITLNRKMYYIHAQLIDIIERSMFDLNMFLNKHYLDSNIEFNNLPNHYAKKSYTNGMDMYNIKNMYYINRCLIEIVPFFVHSDTQTREDCKFFTLYPANYMESGEGFNFKSYIYVYKHDIVLKNIENTNV